MNSPILPKNRWDTALRGLRIAIIGTAYVVTISGRVLRISGGAFEKIGTFAQTKGVELLPPQK